MNIQTHSTKMSCPVLEKAYKGVIAERSLYIHAKLSASIMPFTPHDLTKADTSNISQCVPVS